MNTGQASMTKGNYSEYYKHNAVEPCNSSDVRDFGKVFLPTLYSIVFIVGFIGNGLVICVLVKYYQRSNMMDVCLLNLALSDLLFLITLPFWAHKAANNQWIFGSFMCLSVTAFYTVGFYGSIFFMILMTVDRYLVTVHAQSSILFKRQSVRVGICLVLLMWALSLGVSSPNFAFSTVVEELGIKSCQPNNTMWKHISYLELNIIGFLLPIIVMGFCYSQIIPTLVTMKSKKRYKAIKLILVLVIIFFVCWTPYNVVVFLHFLHHLKFLQDCYWHTNLHLAMQWAETIAFSHCCVNPVIYAFVGQRFRTLVVKTLKDWFPVCFSHCNAITRDLTLKRSSIRNTETVTSIL